MDRKSPQEIANPVRSKLRVGGGGRRIGYMQLNTFNARAAPELKARSHCLCRLMLLFLIHSVCSHVGARGMAPSAAPADVKQMLVKCELLIAGQILASRPALFRHLLRLGQFKVGEMCGNCSSLERPALSANTSLSRG